jgi:hypothetical protein
MTTNNDYVPWPEKGGPATFAMLADSICAAIRFAYQLKRQNQDQDIPWTGPDIGEDDEQLSAEMLALIEKDQGRDALDEIVGLALRLGIEQGRRGLYFAMGPQVPARDPGRTSLFTYDELRELLGLKTEVKLNERDVAELERFLEDAEHSP